MTTMQRVYSASYQGLKAERDRISSLPETVNAQAVQVAIDTLESAMMDAAEEFEAIQAVIEERSVRVPPPPPNPPDDDF